MTARITSGATRATVTSVKPRLSISAVDPVTSITRVIPVVDLGYIFLVLSAELDSSGRYRYIADAFTVVDNVQLTFTKPVADAFALTDGIASISTTKGLADTFTFTEVFSAVLVFIRNFTDSVSFSDQTSFGVGKALADPVTFSEALSRSISKSLSDGFALDDTVAVGDGIAYSFTKSLNNVFFLSDTVSRIMTKNLADPVTLSDSGSALMQSYCDITYFAEDYVGVGFTF